MSTVVFVHAHPDDEALLTGGTMARLSAEGHRVVLVTATDGAAGLSDPAVGGNDLAAVRSDELRRAGRALGCARIVCLGYPDSGSATSPPAGRFAALPVAEPANRLAQLLADEHADAVVGYDPAGGYGHPDHRHVHRVTRIAAREAATPRLLEATVDRRALQRALRLAIPFTRGNPDYRPDRFADRYTAAADITHCIDVRAHLDAKRLAMRAHASQRTGGDQARSLDRFLRLPAPLFAAVFGREWFVEVDSPPSGARRRHLFEPGARPTASTLA